MTIPTNPFYIASMKERLAFKNFLTLYNLFPEENHLISQTPYDGSDCYDFMIQKHSDGTIQRRIIIEVKIRQIDGSIKDMANRDGWVFEKKKYDDLVKIRSLDPELNMIFYINFTQDGTLIWNINQLEKEGKLDNHSQKEMKKATMGGNDTRDKDTYLLLPEWGRLFNYKFDELQWTSHIKEIEKIELENRMRNDRTQYIKKPGFEL